MSILESRIYNLICQSDGITAKEIAKNLKVEGKRVVFLLKYTKR